MKNSKELGAKLAGATALTLLLATSAFADSRPQDATWRNDLNRRGAASDRSSGDRRNNNGNRGTTNGNRGTNRDRSVNNADRGSNADRGYNGNRGTNNSNRGYNSGYNRGYRDNERVNLHGRVTSFNRERGGYRVYLDGGGYPFWVPDSYFRNRGPRVGISVVLGGIFRGGSIYVDAVNWPGDYGYGGGYGGGTYDNGYVRGVVDRVDYRAGTVWLRDEASGRLIAAEMRSSDRYSRLNFGDLRRGDYVELSGQWARGGVFEAYRIDSVR